MELKLAPELQRFVDESIRNGEYRSAQEVVEAGIARLMLDPVNDFDDELLDQLEEAERQIDRGQSRTWAEVKAELLARRSPK